jgi:DNA repair exonuclease SbcCD nuclease subunit
MNVLVIGDPHFMDSSTIETNELTLKICDLLKFANTKNCTLDQVINMYTVSDKSISEVNSNIFDGIDFALIMGDMLDKHEKATVYPHYYSIQLLKKIKEIVPLFVLMGNHDRPNHSDFLSNYHFFTGLEECKNLYIIDKVKVYSVYKENGILCINDLEKGEINKEINTSFKYLFVPYVPNGKFMDAIQIKMEYIKDITSINCIFAHQEFFGAKYNGIISDNGDKITIENFPLIVSGHIHEYHKVGGGQRIIYIGSSRQIAKNENPNKTISLFRFGEQSEYKEHRISLNLIKKVTINIKVGDINGLVIPNNCIVYVIISGNSSEIKALKKMNAFRLLDKNKNVKFSYDIKDDEDDKSILHDDQVITSTESGNAIPYLSKLRDKVGSNPELISIFNRLFKA